MPTYHSGEDMWDVLDQADLFLITTCASLNSKGELVMGAGITKEAKTRFPWLPRSLGNLLPCYYGWPIYGVMTVYSQHLRRPLGAFQIKYSWKEPARLDLIAYSVRCLLDDCSHYIALNFPGIGHGGLPREAVKPWVDLLPDNVHVYER
jgi:hypothetical protein